MFCVGFGCGVVSLCGTLFFFVVPWCFLSLNSFSLFFQQFPVCARIAVGVGSVIMAVPCDCK